MSLPPFQFLSPQSTGELTQMLAEHGEDARILAGGTDLINMIAGEVLAPKVVIDINRIEALSTITYEPGKGLTIGAAAKIEDIEKSQVVREKYFSLYQAASEIGSPQVRAMGSVGGNCCNASPCADTPPPMVTFGATVRLLGPAGRREIALEAFIQGNRQTAIAADEFMESVFLPEPWEHSVSRFSAMGLRNAQEIDIVSVAVNAGVHPAKGTVDNLRISLGAVAPTPMRAVKAEAMLIGRKATGERIAEAAASCAQECSPIDDLRGSAAYRRHLVNVVAGRTLREALSVQDG